MFRVCALAALVFTFSVTPVCGHKFLGTQDALKLSDEDDMGDYLEGSDDGDFGSYGSDSGDVEQGDDGTVADDTADDFDVSNEAASDAVIKAAEGRPLDTDRFLTSQLGAAGRAAAALAFQHHLSSATPAGMPAPRLASAVLPMTQQAPRQHQHQHKHLHHQQHLVSPAPQTSSVPQQQFALANRQHLASATPQQLPTMMSGHVAAESTIANNAAADTGSSSASTVSTATGTDVATVADIATGADNSQVVAADVTKPAQVETAVVASLGSSFETDSGLATPAASVSLGNTSTPIAQDAGLASADAAAAEAVSKSQADYQADLTKEAATNLAATNAADAATAADAGGATNGDIDMEAKEVEQEDAHILADASGNERAEMQDEEFEDTIDTTDKGKAEGTWVDPMDKTKDKMPDDGFVDDDQVQLAAEDEENHRTGNYARDVKDEAKEIEDEDSEIENENIADERAGAELEELSPEDETPSELPAAPSKIAPLAVPAHAVALHLSGEHGGMKPISTASGGNAVEAMRRALAATKDLLPASPLSSNAETHGTPGLRNAIMNAASVGHPALQSTHTNAHSGIPDSRKRVLIQSKHDGEEEDFEGDSEGDDALEEQNAMEVTEEGDRGNQDLDPVESVIASEGADETSTEPEAENMESGSEAEGLDDVEASIVSEEEPEGMNSEEDLSQDF